MADEREDRTMKQTEIGMIPDDWEVKELGKISFVTKLAGFEFTAHVKYSDQGTIIALRGLNVRQGVLELKDVKYIDNSNFSKLNRSKLYKNDLLFTYVGTVGNVALVDKNDSYYLAPNVALIRNTRQTDSQYIMYLLLSTNFFNSQIKTLMSTTSQAALSMTNIRLFKISLPPTLAEQQKIAKALSDVDNVISTLEKLITKKKNLKQGTMQQLLIGKKRLPGFAKSNKFKQTEIGEIPEDWEVKKLCEIFDFRPNNTFTREDLNDSEGIYQNVHYGDVLIKYPSILDCDKESIPYINIDKDVKFSKYGIKEGDIIIADTAEDETVGKVVEIYNLGNKKLVSGLHTFLCRKITDDFAPKWLGYFMNQSIFHNQLLPFITGTKVSAISRTAIQNVKVMIPSKPEQTAIANVLSSMDKEIEALEAKLGKYRNLKTGMMQQLLTGKIRLV